MIGQPFEHQGHNKTHNTRRHDTRERQGDQNDGGGREGLFISLGADLEELLEDGGNLGLVDQEDGPVVLQRAVKGPARGLLAVHDRESEEEVRLLSNIGTPRAS